MKIVDFFLLERAISFGGSLRLTVYINDYLCRQSVTSLRHALIYSQKHIQLFSNVLKRSFKFYGNDIGVLDESYIEFDLDFHDID